MTDQTIVTVTSHEYDLQHSVTLAPKIMNYSLRFLPASQYCCTQGKGMGHGGHTSRQELGTESMLTSETSFYKGENLEQKEGK